MARSSGELACEFQCAICHSLLLYEAACQTPCDHMYCEPCIAAWLRTSTSGGATRGRCPSCSAVLHMDDLKPLQRANRLMHRCLGKISVRGKKSTILLLA